MLWKERRFPPGETEGGALATPLAILARGSSPLRGYRGHRLIGWCRPFPGQHNLFDTYSPVDRMALNR